MEENIAESSIVSNDESSFVEDNIILSNDELPEEYHKFPITSSLSQQNATEILMYCQNFNRMKSPVKMKEIQQKLLSSSFNVILGTETSWDESVRSEEVFGNHFNVFRSDRNLSLSNKKSGGGVLIAIHADFTSEVIMTSKNEEFEHVWVKAIFAGEVHILCSVYFPPDYANKQSFESFFQTALTILSNTEPEVKLHIYGDFNQRSADFIMDDENESILLPVIGENETLQYLFDQLARLGLYQVNHIKNQQNSYLDLLYTNSIEDFCVNASLSPLWKNEVFHTAIEYSFFIHSSTLPTDWEYEEVREFYKTNFDEAKRRLRTINWQNILSNKGNVDTQAELFYSVINNIISETVPMKKRRRTHHSKLPVWFNPQLKYLRNRKQKAHKFYKKENSINNLRNYLTICGELHTAIKSAQEEYNSKIESEVKSSPKNFFNYVKIQLISSNFPSRMLFDGQVGNSSQEICHPFANFFQEVYTTFADKDRDRNYFSFSPVFPTTYLSVDFRSKKSSTH